MSCYHQRAEEFDLCEQTSSTAKLKENLVALSFPPIQIYDYNNKDNIIKYLLVPFETESVNNKYTTVSHVVKSAAIDKRCSIVTKP